MFIWAERQRCVPILLPSCKEEVVVNKIITTKHAPKAIGPYSQAVQTAGGILFISGQVPLDPATGEMVPGGVEEQADRVLANLKAVLEEAGYSVGDVVKTTVYITDIGDFAKINGVYSRYFTKNCPARVCIEASNLPKGALVEIDAVAPDRKSVV